MVHTDSRLAARIDDLVYLAHVSLRTVEREAAKQEVAYTKRIPAMVNAAIGAMNFYQELCQ